MTTDKDRAQMIHVGDTVQFRRNDQDAYGLVTRLTEPSGGLLASIDEAGHVYMRYSSTVTVTQCPHESDATQKIAVNSMYGKRPAQHVDSPAYRGGSLPRQLVTETDAVSAYPPELRVMNRAEHLIICALNDVRSDRDAIPALSAAIAQLRIEVGELPSDELDGYCCDCDEDKNECPFDDAQDGLVKTQDRAVYPHSAPLPLPTLPTPSDRLRLRTELGITQKIAATKLQVTRKTYSTWERGLIDPTGQNRIRYSRLLSAWSDILSTRK